MRGRESWSTSLAALQGGVSQCCVKWTCCCSAAGELPDSLSLAPLLSLNTLRYFSTGGGREGGHVPPQRPSVSFTGFVFSHIWVKLSVGAGCYCSTWTPQMSVFLHWYLDMALCQGLCIFKGI